MIFLFFYLLFAAASGYIWFQIYKYWSEENVTGNNKIYGYRTKHGMSTDRTQKEYRYEVKPLYILGFIFLTLLSLIGVVIGMVTANEEEIDVVNIKIK